MKKRIWFLGALLGAALFALLLTPGSPVALARVALPTDVILLDPGHGGFDGGAESSSGLCEKDINLAVALMVRQMAEADGWQVVMTRDTDMALCGKDEGSIRSMKTRDLQARRALIDETAPLLAVSIHLNSFRQDPSVRGAQTFFSNGSGDSRVLEEGRKLAEAVQAALVSGLNDGTDRVALGKSDVLLLKGPTVPTVIVECGFLSNQAEERLLRQEAYQRKLAECIYRGILEYSGKEPLPKPILLDSLS